MPSDNPRVEKIENIICRLLDSAKSQQIGQNALQIAQSVQCLAQSRFIADSSKSSNADMFDKFESAIIKLTEMSGAAPVPASTQQFAQAVQCFSQAEFALSGEKLVSSKKPN